MVVLGDIGSSVDTAMLCDLVGSLTTGRSEELCACVNCACLIRLPSEKFGVYSLEPAFVKVKQL